MTKGVEKIMGKRISVHLSVWRSFLGLHTEKTVKLELSCAVEIISSLQGCPGPGSSRTQ